MSDHRMAPGDTVIVDWPGNALHGKAVRVVEIVPDFNIAPEGAEPVRCELIQIDHPSFPRGERIYHSRSRIAGTVENARLRAEESETDERQGELLL